MLWENACYLLTDERRREVFEGLRERVALNPAAILEASRDTLLTLAKRGGMRPETRVFRWREIARITQDQFGGGLDRILKGPYAAAKTALKAVSDYRRSEGGLVRIFLSNRTGCGS